jgi:hypothetical protein
VPARDVGLDNFSTLGVVEDQQPAQVGLQPAEDGGGPGALVGIGGLGQAQLAGEVGEGRRQGGRVLGGEPEDGVVVVGMAVGELDGHQRLADPTQTVDGGRLRQRRAAGGGQCLLQRGEFAGPADEVGIAATRDHPDRTIGDRHRNPLSTSTGWGGSPRTTGRPPENRNDSWVMNLRDLS